MCKLLIKQKLFVVKQWRAFFPATLTLHDWYLSRTITVNPTTARDKIQEVVNVDVVCLCVWINVCGKHLSFYDFNTFTTHGGSAPFESVQFVGLLPDT